MNQSKNIAKKYKPKQTSKAPTYFEESKTATKDLGSVLGSFGETPKGQPTRFIIWLRNDLRLRDNQAFQKAMMAKNKECIPVFCFDPRIYQGQLTDFGTRKTGLLRMKFQLESIACLRNQLKLIGSNLVVSNSKPEEFIPKLVSDKFHNVIVYRRRPVVRSWQSSRD